ncbi:DUF4232 domain-containing protein [Streptomyces sp. NBC_01497]|uniref:DUF4232 domain-containing protein n=1 Tax=Streptomyces sp. NBC_01497 TaxID=2903885 RepID=UPI002E2FB980|nr:DUF4232 domain-containing protein [Streptomyces sp. NBC_01497]
MRRGMVAACLAALLAVAGCGTERAGDGGPPHAPTATASAASPRPRVSAGAELGVDGVVPWVAEPAVDADFTTPSPAPPPVTGPTCRATRLSGTVRHWASKGAGDEEVHDPTMAASLYGYAVLTNTGKAACRLRGAPRLTLRGAGGKDVPIGHDAFSGASAPVGLPPGGKASFRIDWDAPFCPAVPGPYTLVADLPDAGTVTVRPADTTVPGCSNDDLHPEVRAYLTSSPITPGDATPRPPVVSDLSSLTARMTGIPATVRPGGPVGLTLALSNPTDRPVSLAGRPGFDLHVLCAGTRGRAGINEDTTYLLNNRPVRAVPAHGTVRFAIRASLPAATPLPGPRLTVGWQMLSRGFPAHLPYAAATIPTGA